MAKNDMDKPSGIKHLISVDDIDMNDLTNYCYLARKAQDNIIHYKQKGKILTNLFYEPSSRTFASFVAAMVKLKGNYIPIQEAGVYSSAVKGESLSDTIKTMGCYSDLIVLRHSDNDAARIAASVSEVPIINAGTGTEEHPTQALLDFYTILNEKGFDPNGLRPKAPTTISEAINGLTVTMMGDLKHGRTVKSFYKLLRKFDIKINWVSPTSLLIDKEYIHPGDIVTEDLNDVIKTTDVLYVTRTQLERINDANLSNFNYQVTEDHMKKAKKKMILMHPLPRNGELPESLDNDPRSAYFRQMKNGLYIRMAVIQHLLG